MFELYLNTSIDCINIELISIKCDEYEPNCKLDPRTPTKIRVIDSTEKWEQNKFI